MADKKPTKEQYEKFKARANDKSISAEARATFQKLVDKFKSEFETAEKEVEKVVEDKPKVTRGRKAGTTAKKRTTKPKTEQSADDIAKAKAEIKKRTGKTEEECESIIEEYKSLRTKAQTRKKAETKAKEDNTRRINKLKKQDNVIEGTTEKTADAVIETNTKDIAKKIEKEIEKVEDKVEREETAKAKKEVEKTSPNKSATEKKKEVEKKVEAQVEKKVKAKTKVVVKKVIIDTTAMLSSIAESLGKFDKDSQKEFLMKLRSDIDKLLTKYMYGGDVSGATQQLDITQSNLSASSVNPSKFAKGGEVGEVKILKLNTQKGVYFEIVGNGEKSLGSDKNGRIFHIQNKKSDYSNWKNINFNQLPKTLQKSYLEDYNHIVKNAEKFAKGGGVGKWSVTDITNATYLGVIEFQDNKGEFHNFEVMETDDRLVFGGMTNSGFIESGYIEKDGFSTDEALQSLLEDLEVYYNDGAEYTSQIVFNQRMAKGGSTYARGGGMRTRRPKYMKGGKIERLKERVPFQTKIHQKELADLKGGKRKTINQYYVQGNYGYGWEDLTSHDTRSEALLEKITYDENESYPHRVVNKRIRKADFDSGNYAEGGRMKNMMRERRGM